MRVYNLIDKEKIRTYGTSKYDNNMIFKKLVLAYLNDHIFKDEEEVIFTPEYNKRLGKILDEL